MGGAPYAPLAVAGRYDRATIALHWATVAVVALAYAFVELREMFPRGTPERAFMRQAHFSLGLTVLALVLVRIVVRLRHPAPAIHPPLPRAQRLGSRMVHGLLYAFLLGMPLAGWVILSLRGDPIPWFGLTLPALAGEDEALAKLLRGWHGDIGRAAYGLIALHAAAALWHHHVRRDDTLRRMWPGP
jgi:superoxide oxidase